MAPVLSAPCMHGAMHTPRKVGHPTGHTVAIRDPSLQPPGSLVSVSYHLWTPAGLTKLSSGVLAFKVKIGHLPHL